MSSMRTVVCQEEHKCSHAHAFACIDNTSPSVGSSTAIYGHSEHCHQLPLWVEHEQPGVHAGECPPGPFMTASWYGRLPWRTAHMLIYDSSSRLVLLRPPRQLQIIQVLHCSFGGLLSLDTVFTNTT